MFDIHPDDVPKLTKEQMEIPDLTIIHRGWVFKYSHGNLLWAFPH